MKKIEHPFLKDVPENVTKIFIIPKDSKGVKEGDILIAKESPYAEGDNSYLIDVEQMRKEWDDSMNPRIFKQ